jgi:hypothetical protein
MRILLLTILAFAGISASEAKPSYVIMDGSVSGMEPAKFGYAVEAERVAEKVHFSISLDANASVKFNSAVISFQRAEGDNQEIAIQVTKDAAGLVILAFNLPETMLSNCTLHIDSGIIRKDDPSDNLAGYKLRIDNLHSAKE